MAARSFVPFVAKQRQFFDQTDENESSKMRFHLCALVSAHVPSTDIYFKFDGSNLSKFSLNPPSNIYLVLSLPLVGSIWSLSDKKWRNYFEWNIFKTNLFNFFKQTLQLYFQPNPLKLHYCSREGKCITNHFFSLKMKKPFFHWHQRKHVWQKPKIMIEFKFCKYFWDFWANLMLLWFSVCSYLFAGGQTTQT